MRQVISLPALLACLCSALMATPTRAQLWENPRLEKGETLISVSGTGRVFQTPDYIDVFVGLDLEEKTAVAVQDRAKAIMGAVIAALEELKLPNFELQNDETVIRPVYRTVQTVEPGSMAYGLQKQVLSGYAVSMTTRVRCSNLQAGARIIDAALAAGATRIGAVTFGVTQVIEAREDALRQAMKAAARKAEVMAESLGLKIARALNADSQAQQRWWSNSQVSNMVQMSSNGASSEATEAPTVVPGKIEVWAEAKVTFAASPSGK